MAESVKEARLVRLLGVREVRAEQAGLLTQQIEGIDDGQPLVVDSRYQADWASALQAVLGREVSARELTVLRVERLTRVWTFVPTGHTYREEVDTWFEAGPPTEVYLGPGGHRALIERLENAYLERLTGEERARQQALLEKRHAFLAELTPARKEVESLALSQQTDLLGYYRMSIDRGFVKVDNDANRTVEQRCALIFSDPTRLNRLVTRLTVDLGYGVSTIVRELLQNIDDAYRDSPPEGKTPWAKFKCDDQWLSVWHDGRRFNEKRHAANASEAPPEDLRGICSLGGTEKDRGLQIGRFGLGFKSVYAITNAPWIYSHPYYFRIDHVVIPRWSAPSEKDIPSFIEAQNSTRFYFKYQPEKQDKFQWLKGKLAQGEQLRPHDLLFLHRLREVTVEVDGTHRTVRRTSCPVPAEFSAPSNSPTPEQVCCWKLEDDRGGTSTSATFLVFSGTQQACVPTAEGDLKENLQAAVAFPWDADQECYVPMESGGGHLFLFLPTGDVTGLPFHLHGQFLTNLGRTDVSGEVECNQRIAERLAQLVRSALLRSFDAWKKEPKRLKTIYHVAPSTQELVTGRCQWLAGVYQVFTSLLLENQSVVLTAAPHGLACPRECWIGSQMVHELHAALSGPTRSSAALKQLAFVKLEETNERALQLLRGHLCEIRGPELVAFLFPSGLSRADAVHRCRSVLLFCLVSSICG